MDSSRLRVFLPNGQTKDDLCVGRLVRVIDDLPSPENVVDRDHAPWPHQNQQLLVVGVVVHFVRVDEGNVGGVGSQLLNARLVVISDWMRWDVAERLCTEGSNTWADFLKSKQGML